MIPLQQHQEETRILLDNEYNIENGQFYLEKVNINKLKTFISQREQELWEKATKEEYKRMQPYLIGQST